MRSDHTATDLAASQPPLAASLDSADEAAPHRGIRAVTRVTFCFAWLFGLEPFLSRTGDDVPPSKLDRH